MPAAKKTPAKKSAGSKSPFTKADKLTEAPVTRKKTEQAVALLEDHLESRPEDGGAHWRVARAWLRLLETETDTVLEEQDEYFPILDELGTLALEAGERAHNLCPDDPDAVGWHMVAYGYYSVSIGIVKAVLKGAAGKYLALADELNGLDETWMSGGGHRAMGRFYREAPWPKRNLKKSIQSFERAIEIGPKRQENKLHLALALADNGDEDQALNLLKKVAKSKPEPAEAHFHKALVDYAKQKIADLS